MDERGWKCSTFPALVTVFLSELMWRIPRMILFRNVPKLEIALYVRHFSTECRTSIRAIVIEVPNASLTSLFGRLLTIYVIDV